jgi:hypothetical protein
VLSVREPLSWYQSFLTLRTQQRGPAGENASEAVRAVGTTMRQIRPLVEQRAKDIFEPAMLDDEQAMIDAYHRYNNLVQETLSPERLLVFDVSEGWEPLCEFLGVRPPEEPFPRVNSTESQQRIWAARAEGRILTPFDPELQSRSEPREM